LVRHLQHQRQPTTAKTLNTIQTAESCVLRFFDSSGPSDGAAGCRLRKRLDVLYNIMLATVCLAPTQ
jgi:hypothetical protein